MPELFQCIFYHICLHSHVKLDISEGAGVPNNFAIDNYPVTAMFHGKAGSRIAAAKNAEQVQAFVMTMLLNKDVFLRHTAAAVALKHQLYQDMLQIDGVKTLPSATNFLTFTAGERSSDLFEYLKQNDIAIRDVGAHPLLARHLRVSVGSSEQNRCFIDTLKRFLA